MDPEITLTELMKTGLAAADPYLAVKTHLPAPPEGGLFILSIGKAASPMARAAADHYRAKTKGILYAPKGYAQKIAGFSVFEGSHPVPGEKNVEITKTIIKAVKGLKRGDLFLALISGGTSALLCAPKGVSLQQKIAETEALLKSGKPVSEINKRRRELSAVKGGKLAEIAGPATVETLIVSDVVGDDPRVVGSAPTGGGRIVLTADRMLEAVEKEARGRGISASNLGQIEGEAVKAAKSHAELVSGYYGTRPHLILSGGETSVTVRGTGKGGRNSEYALALCFALKGARGIYGLAVDSDGFDGTGPFAGAMFGPETLNSSRGLRIDPEKSLKNNDSGGFFKAVGGLIETGPTLTNLNDLRMILLV